MCEFSCKVHVVVMGFHNGDADKRSYYIGAVISFSNHWTAFPGVGSTDKKPGFSRYQTRFFVVQPTCADRNIKKMLSHRSTTPRLLWPYGSNSCCKWRTKYRHILRTLFFHPKDDEDFEQYISLITVLFPKYQTRDTSPHHLFS